ncbi:MAG: PD-(D/E)XK nuclease family protein [Candidatus Chromulinivorax sp.]|nr:PD-(D/E)XK nuclease family protein [Candidatus Chromulinivorax sp.]
MLQRFMICALFIGLHTSSYASSSNTTTSQRKKPKRPFSEMSLNQTLDIEEEMRTEQAISHPLLKQRKTHDYNPTRVRGIYSSSQDTYAVSRSKIEDFIKCQACFYIDRKLGTGRPAGFPFSLNIAVDNNMKNEFDEHRENKTEHPYCTAYDLQAQKENRLLINAVPFQHPKMDEWRNSRTQGLRYKVPGTNIEFHGGVDDIWQNRITKELYVVDYKATSKKGAVSLDAPWQDSYKRQMAMYQYLLRKNLEKDGYKVSNTGFFVYSNAKADKDHFEDQLNFETPILAYEGDDSWVEPAIVHAYQCLQAHTIPASSDYCEQCLYYNQRVKLAEQHNGK